MSKQSNLVNQILNMLFSCVLQEVDISKITKNDLNRGIRVDYYIPDKNLVVEVHGIQHFEASGFGKNQVDTMTQFSKQLNRDDKLRDLCNKKGITLVEIPYSATKGEVMQMLANYV